MESAGMGNDKCEKVVGKVLTEMVLLYTMMQRCKEYFILPFMAEGEETYDGE